jgi:hypothetical protein
LTDGQVTVVPPGPMMGPEGASHFENRPTWMKPPEIAMDLIEAIGQDKESREDRQAVRGRTQPHGHGPNTVAVNSWYPEPSIRCWKPPSISAAA